MGNSGVSFDSSFQGLHACHVQECSKQQVSCQELQVQGLALQAASDKAAAAQAAIDSAERLAQEASTAAAWEVKKRQELVEAHDAKLFAMQQELLKVGVVSCMLYNSVYAHAYMPSAFISGCA